MVAARRVSPAPAARGGRLITAGENVGRSWRYTEGEVSADKLSRKQVDFVLRRAAEIDCGLGGAQGEGQHDPEPNDALSVVEVMRLGEEAGLGSEAIAQALTEMKRGAIIEAEPNDAISRTLGPTHIGVIRVVPREAARAAPAHGRAVGAGLRGAGAGRRGGDAGLRPVRHRRPGQRGRGGGQHLRSRAAAVPGEPQPGRAGAGALPGPAGATAPARP